MNRKLLGALSGIIAASIWGGMYVVSDAVLDVVPPATLVLIRYVIALPVLLIAFWLTAVFVKRKGGHLMIEKGATLSQLTII